MISFILGVVFGLVVGFIFGNERGYNLGADSVVAVAAAPTKTIVRTVPVVVMAKSKKGRTTKAKPSKKQSKGKTSKKR